MLDLQNMLQPYYGSISYAFLAFPLIAAVLTLPFLLIQYHRYGALSFARGMILYSFTLYLLCMYFLVVLPLPSFADAAASTAPYLQLSPFHCFRDLLSVDGFSPRVFSTYRVLLHSSDFWQVFFNVALFIPLGVYLKYYFRKNWFTTILIGFAVSLFFELTQLTALYGIYPRPYRMFDVDDLLLNTFGVLLGHILAPLLTLLLPSREAMDHKALSRSGDISLLRRLLANLVDGGVVVLLMYLFQQLLGIPTLFAATFGNVLLYFVSVFLCCICLPTLTKGRTIGKALVKIAIVTEKNAPPRFRQIALRNALLYGLILPSPIFAFQLNSYSYTVQASPFFTFLVGIFALIFLGSFGYYLWTWQKGKGRFLHEKWSHTKLLSTL